jgi:hypothetical protein
MIDRLRTLGVPRVKGQDCTVSESPCQELTCPAVHSRAMGGFANTKLARMSSGRYCLIRDLGLVKGGKGLRHHEVVLELSWRGLVRFLTSKILTEQTMPATASEPESAKPVAHQDCRLDTGGQPSHRINTAA